MLAVAPTWITNLVALSTVAMWLAAMAVGVITQNWEPLTVTTPVMMLLAGFAFGIKIIRRQGDGNGNAG